MRKELAGLGPRLINRAEIAVQEDAAVFATLQDPPLIRAQNGVIANKLSRFHAEKASQALDIAFTNLRCCHPAAVRTLRAVNVILNGLRDGFEPFFDEVVMLHPGSEFLVLIPLLFAKPLDLDEVDYHPAIISGPECAQNMLALFCFGRSSRTHNGVVTDQLSLSIWLERHSRINRLRHFETLLRLFPFSQREQPQSTLSIMAVSVNEPPLLEKPYNGPFEQSDILAALRDYKGEDVAYSLETWWDLWQLDVDWELVPARVTLSCFGPDFDNGTERESGQQEDLRIDFGVDTYFLPLLNVPGAGKLIESNVRSLLRLVHELDTKLPVEMRRLETESGENFAERLERVLTTGTVQ